eukprot:297846-Chlamydomonas_euryale.AAC.6
MQRCFAHDIHASVGHTAVPPKRGDLACCFKPAQCVGQCHTNIAMAYHNQIACALAIVTHSFLEVCHRKLLPQENTMDYSETNKGSSMQPQNKQQTKWFGYVGVLFTPTRPWSDLDQALVGPGNGSTLKEMQISSRSAAGLQWAERDFVKAPVADLAHCASCPANGPQPSAGMDFGPSVRPLLEHASALWNAACTKSVPSSSQLDGMQGSSRKGGSLHSSSSLAQGEVMRRVTPLPHQRFLSWGCKTHVMGVLNVTPDSFSDGGKLLGSRGINVALEAARQLLHDGAHMLDVGGQSTRPGAERVSPEEEAARVVPLIRAMRQDDVVHDAVVSVDTFYAHVAEAAVNAGADMVNDVSGGQLDAAMLSTVSRLGVPYILMHMRGDPKTMQQQHHTSYDCVWTDVAQELQAAADKAMAAGIPAWNIILDPGIGFAKNQAGNLQLIRHLGDLRKALHPPFAAGPLLVGPSRKNFLGAITGRQLPAERDAATVAAACACVGGGGLADIVRVHNTRDVGDGLKVADAIYRRRRLRSFMCMQLGYVDCLDGKHDGTMLWLFTIETAISPDRRRLPSDRLVSRKIFETVYARLEALPACSVAPRPNWSSEHVDATLRRARCCNTHRGLGSRGIRGRAAPGARSRGCSLGREVDAESRNQPVAAAAVRSKQVRTMHGSETFIPQTPRMLEHFRLQYAFDTYIRVYWPSLARPVYHNSVLGAQLVLRTTASSLRTHSTPRSCGTPTVLLGSTETLPQHIAHQRSSRRAVLLTLSQVQLHAAASCNVGRVRCRHKCCGGPPAGVSGRRASSLVSSGAFRRPRHVQLVGVPLPHLAHGRAACGAWNSADARAASAAASSVSVRQRASRSRVCDATHRLAAAQTVRL